LPLGLLAAGERELAPGPARYLTRVHRLAPQDRFLAFDPEKRLEADAEVLAVGRRVTVRLGPTRQATAVPARPVTVIQAAGKGGKVDAVVRDATELGATSVVVVVTERSVRQQPGSGSLARWRRVALESARQCGRGDVPAIAGPTTLAAALPFASGTRLLLAVGAETGFGEALRGLAPTEPVTLAIGPEGGFGPGEMELALRHGFAPASLGRFVLRTETACAAALGALAAMGG
jgi:16S rRNA (uracil1498-N3)-methyltransferase